MTTNPMDFASYAHGVSLLSADYSGGAAGTFTDLVSGNRDWVVQGTTPTFETRAGLEGVKFTGLANESIFSPNYAVGEWCAVAIVQPDNTGSQYFIGGTDPAVNAFGMSTNGNRASMFFPNAGTGFTASVTMTAPVVIAVSLCPRNNTGYATVYNGTLTKTSLAKGMTNATVNQNQYAQQAIGRMRTSYLTGWVGEAHVFHASLHQRNETALDDMLVTLGAKVGL